MVPELASSPELPVRPALRGIPVRAVISLNVNPGAAFNLYLIACSPTWLGASFVYKNHCGLLQSWRFIYTYNDLFDISVH
jgi:hypothetical protein